MGDEDLNVKELRKRTRRRLWLWLTAVGLLAVVSGLYAPVGRFTDWVAFGSAGLLVLYGVVSWAWGNISENWANVNPSPIPPPLQPRYWPGSKADLAQKAAAKRPGREVV